MTVKLYNKQVQYIQYAQAYIIIIRRTRFRQKALNVTARYTKQNSWKRFTATYLRQITRFII